MKIGSDLNGELTFIDVVNLIGLMVGIQNLDENINQDELSNQLDKVLTEVHSHLKEQDLKIDTILEALKNDKD